MTAKSYETTIKVHMIAKNVIEHDDKSFDVMIKTLAEVLHKRDLAQLQFKKEGCQLLITKTSDRGAENQVKNPLLTIIADLEAEALQYWKELGMTPAMMKKLGDKEAKVDPMDAFNLLVTELEV